MKLLHILIAAAALHTAPAWAVSETVPSKGDSRIRFVEYDPADVVPLVAKYGRQTFVKFAEDEKIEDLGGGDTDAWEIGVTTRPNSFFIKPKARSPNTNITVVTNKRHYNFELQLYAEAQPKKNGKPRVAPTGTNMYMVWFRYPQDDAKAKAMADQGKRVDQLLQQGATARNRAYTVQGASSITPTEAFDDGSFTYLRFAPRADMPAVYYVGEDGIEKLATFNVKDDVLVVHRVAPKLVLRRGDVLVACIFNEAFDPVGAKRPTNTKSPAVERVIKGAE
jgi:type IV secretion system protein VirB9